MPGFPGGSLDTTSLLLGLLFGSVGVGYWMYGRKQKRPVVLWTGVVLMVYPYFVASVAMLVAVGVVLALLPFFWRD